MLAAVMLGTALSGGEAKAADPGAAVTDISRYCQACWRNARLPADHWPDATQQVFVRLLERVDPTRWGAALNDDGLERREFLRAIDTVKKRTQREKKPGFLPETVAEPGTAESAKRADDRNWLRANALLLSERQKRILDLTATGHDVPEIASALGTSVARVSDEKYKAIRKLKAKHDAEAA
jgi:RNA polymerase sigma factor (sigma-70 family)